MITSHAQETSRAHLISITCSRNNLCSRDKFTCGRNNFTWTRDTFTYAYNFMCTRDNYMRAPNNSRGHVKTITCACNKYNVRTWWHTKYFQSRTPFLILRWDAQVRDCAKSFTSVLKRLRPVSYCVHPVKASYGREAHLEPYNSTQ